MWGGGGGGGLGGGDACGGEGGTKEEMVEAGVVWAGGRSLAAGAGREREEVRAVVLECKYKYMYS